MNMKANKKFIEEDEAVSAVIGVILMVAITVAIAATVYVYVTGMIGGGTQQTENASVTATSTADDRIKITLAQGGQRYDNGYDKDEYTVFINGEIVSSATTEAKTWIAGEGIFIGQTDTAAGSSVTAGATTSLSGGDYTVTVTILDTVVLDSSVHIG